MVDVKYDKDIFAVMVHSDECTGAIETMLFPDVEMAKSFCYVQFNIPENEWDSYLVASDPNSNLKLNGEPVRYCGWRHEMDEGEALHIHLEKMVVEF